MESGIRSTDLGTAGVDAIHKDKISPEGVLTYQEEEARHAFQEGKAVFMRNWPYAWNLLQEEKSPVRGKVGIIPMVHGPSGKSAATSEATKFSLLPTPITTGQPARASTIVSGESCESTASA